MSDFVISAGNAHKEPDAGGNRLNSGSRRNFILRMKCGTYEDENQDANITRLAEIKTRCKNRRMLYADESYAILHCTGYIRVGSLMLYLVESYAILHCTGYIRVDFLTVS